METIISEPIDLEKMADLCSAGIERPPLTPRDHSLWHVSNLLKSGKEIVKGNTQYHEFVGQPSGIMSMGRIWESAVDCYLSDYAKDKGGFYDPDHEITKDEILGSLDGLMYLPQYGWIVCESKLRFTMNTVIPLDHEQQVRAYCHLAGTDLVLYTSGHISSAPPEAKARMLLARMTQQSIDETWQGVVNTKNYLLGLGVRPSGG